LEIRGNSVLTSLSTLSNLTDVGDLYIVGTVLTNLSGLENITSIDGSLIIEFNNSLTNLSGLENITSVGGVLSVSENNVLTSYSGLESITSVGSVLYIYNNPVLTSLEALNNLTSVGGSLDIGTNPSLTSLSGLNNLTSVGGGFKISFNDALTSLNELENLSNVGSFLQILYNDSLTNLCALYNVHLTSSRLYIYNNSVLSMDTAYALETQLRHNGFTGTSDIHDNSGTVQVFCDNDKDTVYNDIDNCPNKCNPIQLDADGDGLGDACDITPGCGGCGQPACEVFCDLDADGILNITDNCPNNCNTQQLDADNDDIGDVCDETPSCGGCGETACEVASCPD
jgi:hypothetical protein